MKNLQQPVGIVVTWGKDLIREKGGLLAFLRYFEQELSSEDGLWLHKCRNRPTQEIDHVYIIVCNQVRYRLYYGGHEAGGFREARNGNGISWCTRSIITWPRLVLAGPFTKAPRKIHMKGFQGFRYVYEPLF